MHVERPAASEAEAAEEADSCPEDMNVNVTEKTDAKVKTDEQSEQQENDKVRITEVVEAEAAAEAAAETDKTVGGDFLSLPCDEGGNVKKAKKKFYTDLRTIRESPETVYTVTYVDAMERHEEIPIPGVMPPVENASQVFVEEVFLAESGDDIKGGTTNDTEPAPIVEENAGDEEHIVDNLIIGEPNEDVPLVKVEEVVTEVDDVDKPKVLMASIPEEEHHDVISPVESHEDDHAQIEPEPQKREVECLPCPGDEPQEADVEDLKALNARADKLSEELKLLNQEAESQKNETEEQSKDFKEIMRQYSDFIIIVRSDEAGNEETIGHTDINALDAAVDEPEVEDQVRSDEVKDDHCNADMKAIEHEPEQISDPIVEQEEGKIEVYEEHIEKKDEKMESQGKEKHSQGTSVLESPSNQEPIPEQEQDSKATNVTVEVEIEKEAACSSNAISEEPATEETSASQEAPPTEGVKAEDNLKDKEKVKLETKLEDKLIAEALERSEATKNNSTPAQHEQPVQKQITVEENEPNKAEFRADIVPRENRIQAEKTCETDSVDIFARCKPDTRTISAISSRQQQEQTPDDKEKSPNEATNADIDREIEEALNAIKNFKPKKPRSTMAQFPDLEVDIEKSMRLQNYGALHYWRMPFRHKLFQENVLQW